MRIELGQYIIRDWERDDASALSGNANNPKIAINLRDRFPHPYTLSDAEAFLTRVDSQKPRTSFAIATASEAIGSIGLMLGQDVHHLTAELGYWLAEPYWGKGIVRWYPPPCQSENARRQTIHITSSGLCFRGKIYG
jgi:RimJ/RimL family protein N-acetyltransferase